MANIRFVNQNDLLFDQYIFQFCLIINIKAIHKIKPRMFCLNHRIGVLFRENLAKKSYQIRYFFIDDQANLFYIANLARLQKIIRISKNFKQVKSHLHATGEKSFNLNRYLLSAVKNYHSQAVLPFSNRTYIELRQKQSKQDKGYQLFGLVDQDTPMLYDQILKLTGKKKVQSEHKLQKRQSVIEQEKIKQQKMIQAFFQRFQESQQKFKMQKLNQQGNDDIQYQGQYHQNQQKKEQKPKAHGKGKQILISQGITYSGQFKNGKKNGPGYLVNSNLDTIYCDFIDDQIAGI